MNVLHDSLTTWGKRRNVHTKELKILEIRDNDNITSQALLMISNSALSLVSLDVRECCNINLNEGLEYLSYLTNLEHLKIGPSTRTHRIRSVAATMGHLKTLTPKLLTFHMSGFPEFSDEDIGELLDTALLLEELSMKNMKYGTNAVEAMCSNIPNLVRLIIHGSSILTDLDFRCITTVCLHLEEITVQKTPLLTDGAFSRCAILRRLKLMDITDCSPLLRGSLFGCFGLCPLEKVVLDRLGFLRPSRDFKMLTPRTASKISYLSMRDCKTVNKEDIESVLSMFLNCLEVDITNCPLLAKQSTLLSINNTHPFLNLVCDGAAMNKSQTLNALIV